MGPGGWRGRGWGREEGGGGGRGDEITDPKSHGEETTAAPHSQIIIFDSKIQAPNPNKLEAYSLIDAVEDASGAVAAEAGVTEAGDPAQAEELSVLVVRLHGVVAASLNVQSHQVLAFPGSVLRLKQVVCQLGETATKKTEA